MTTAEQFRSIVAPTSEVPVAGVPWPRYKVIALAVGFAVLLVVGLVTTSAAPSVLAGAGAGALVWVALGILARR